MPIIIYSLFSVLPRWSRKVKWHDTIKYIIIRHSSLLCYYQHPSFLKSEAISKAFCLGVANLVMLLNACVQKFLKYNLCCCIYFYHLLVIREKIMTVKWLNHATSAIPKYWTTLHPLSLVLTIFHLLSIAVTYRKMQQVRNIQHNEL